MSSKPAGEYWKEEYSDDDWWVEHGYANPEDVPVPDWHIAILEERMARYQSEPVEWIPWEDVYKGLMQEITDAIKRREK